MNENGVLEIFAECHFHILKTSATLRQILHLHRFVEMIKQPSRVSHLHDGWQRMTCCSIHQDYEGERRARERRILELQDQLESMTAQQKTTEQSAAQFQGAVTKNKEDQYRLR